MTSEGRDAAAKSELALADEELRLAGVVLASSSPRIAVARVYFAVFHAARACLYAANLEPTTHAGVNHLFSLHFVRTGRFEPATSRLIARLQKYREEADNDSAFVIDAAAATEEIEAARQFVERVRAELAV